MKKILVLVLALVMALSAVSALADITIVQNKVEIDAALQEYAAAYTEATGVAVKVITGGGSSDYNTVLKAEFASGSEPDIFVIEGPTGYELYKEKIADLSDNEWVQYTAAAYMDGDKVVGFPVAVEGYGMAYNADILAKAEIDPATLTNIDAYQAAFEKLDSQTFGLAADDGERRVLTRFEVSPADAARAASAKATAETRNLIISRLLSVATKKLWGYRIPHPSAQV